MMVQTVLLADCLSRSCSLQMVTLLGLTIWSSSSLKSGRTSIWARRFALRSFSSVCFLLTDRPNALFDPSFCEAEPSCIILSGSIAEDRRRERSRAQIRSRNRPG